MFELLLGGKLLKLLRHLSGWGGEGERERGEGRGEGGVEESHTRQELFMPTDFETSAMCW